VILHTLVVEIYGKENAPTMFYHFEKLKRTKRKTWQI